MIDEKVVLAIFENLGVIMRNGHFVYTSGRHGSEYINKRALFRDKWQTMRICREIAKRFVSEKPDFVIGPETGGAKMATYIADELTYRTRKDVVGLALKKGPEADLELAAKVTFLNKKVLIVDDVTTTGGSIGRVARTVKLLRGTVVGAAAICDRAGITAKRLGVPKFIALARLKLKSWKAPCPLCRQGMPVTPTPQ